MPKREYCAPVELNDDESDNLETKTSVHGEQLLDLRAVSGDYAQYLHNHYISADSEEDIRRQEVSLSSQENIVLTEKDLLLTTQLCNFSK
jgi:hypothetical protein